MNNIICWKFSKQKLIYALSVPLHPSSSSNSTKRASFQSKCSSLVYRETIKELSEMSVANENESSSPPIGRRSSPRTKGGSFFQRCFIPPSFFIASIVNDARQFFMITREAVLDFQRKTLSHLSTGLLSLVRVKKERGCVPIN